MGKVRAIFLDRDGVINELIYYREQGLIDSPFTSDQFRLCPGASEAIKRFHEMDYKVIGGELQFPVFFIPFGKMRLAAGGSQTLPYIEIRSHQQKVV